MNTKPKNDLISLHKASVISGVSTEIIKRMINSGKVKSIRYNRFSSYINPAEIPTIIELKTEFMLVNLR